MRRETINYATVKYETVEALPEEVKNIYVKIKEQIDEDQFPFKLIIKGFHTSFT